MLRLIICLGLFAVGYHMGRKSGREEAGRDRADLEL